MCQNLNTNPVIWRLSQYKNLLEKKHFPNNNNNKFEIRKSLTEDRKLYILLSRINLKDLSRGFEDSQLINIDLG
jgi:hypothetical protein